MAALFYILKTRLKNQLKVFFKSPSKVILLILILLVLVISLLFGDASRGSEINKLRDIRELYAALTVLYAVMFFLMCYGGLQNGASMFSMADINLVFSSPVSPKKILIYGLIQQMGTSLLIGFFILFQYGWLNPVYGISYSFILYTILGYAFCAFCGQLTAMLIYMFCGHDEAKKRVVKILFVLAVFAIPAYGMLYGFRSGAFNLQTLTEASAHSFVLYFPVIGWSRLFVFGAYEGAIYCVLIGAGALAAFVALLILLTVKLRPDYYEDVLRAAEVSFSAITAKKEGKATEAAPKNIRLGHVGLEKGWGANALYFKHKIENRRCRIFLFSASGLIFLAFNITYALFLNNILSVFLFSTYMQLFSSAMGRMPQELLMPYVYLIPEPPFRKLLQSMRESLPRILIEAAVLYGAMIPILQLHPLEALLCAAARVSFAFLFLAGNVAVERLFGTVTKKSLIMVAYVVGLMVLSVPAVVLAILCSAAAALTGMFTALSAAMLGILLANIPVSLLVLYLCRNVLQYAELNHK